MNRVKWINVCRIPDTVSTTWQLLSFATLGWCIPKKNADTWEGNIWKEAWAWNQRTHMWVPLLPFTGCMILISYYTSVRVAVERKAQMAQWIQTSMCWEARFRALGTRFNWIEPSWRVPPGSGSYFPQQFTCQRNPLSLHRESWPREVVLVIFLTPQVLALW